MKRKIIFWVENKPYQTFSYIYAGMKRAFEKLGCETYWFSDQSFPSASEFDYSNCIFFIDNQGPLDWNVPIIDSGIYFAYDKFTNVNKYLDKVKCLINYRVAEFKHPILDNDRYVEIEKGVIFDTQTPEPYNVVHFHYATNLLPEEIDLNWAKKNRNNEYNFVGTIHDPRPNCEPIHQQFIEIVKEKQDLLTSENAQEIFDLGMENQNNIELISHLMEIVKRDHTYMNRCKGILSIVEEVE